MELAIRIYRMLPSFLNQDIDARFESLLFRSHIAFSIMLNTYVMPK